MVGMMKLRSHNLALQVQNRRPMGLQNSATSDRGRIHGHEDD